MIAILAMDRLPARMPERGAINPGDAFVTAHHEPEIDLTVPTAMGR
jgi:hypothetical protein